MQYEKINHWITVASQYSVILIALTLPFSTALMNIATVLTVLLIFLSGHWRKKFDVIKYNPIVWGAMLLFGMYVIGMFYSDASWHDRLQVLNKYNKLLLIPLLMPLFLDAKIRKLTLHVFMFAMVVVLICSYLQYFHFPLFKMVKNGMVYYMGFGPGSVFKNHSTSNLLMAFSAYLWLIAAVELKKYRYLCWLIAYLMIINVFFISDGRIGYLIMCGLLSLYFFMRFSWHGLLVGVISSILLLFAAYHFSTTFKSRTEYLTPVVVSVSHQDQSLDVRKNQANTAILMIKQHPFFGVGTGDFADNYHKTSALRDFSDNVQTQYLQTFAELGVVGLILLLLLMAQQFRWAFKLEQPYNMVALGLVLTQGLAFVTLAAWMDTTESHLFALFIAWCFVGLDNRKAHEK